MTMAKLKGGFSSSRSKKLHMQESGAAGFSSDMEHKFSDKYDENTSPVACKGSFVVPIPEKEFNVFDYPGIPPPKADMLPMMHTVKPHPVASAANKDNFSEEVTLVVLQGKDHKEDEVSTSSGRMTIIPRETEAEPCLMDTKGKPMKVTGRPLNLRNGFQTRKRAARSYWKFFRVFILLGLTFSFVPGSDAVNCFTCKDKAECENLHIIYEPVNDTKLYMREATQEIGECPKSFPPTFEKCTVCKTTADVLIICPNDVGAIEVETTNGSQRVIPCREPYLHGRGNYGSIPSFGLFLIMAAALIYCKSQH